MLFDVTDAKPSLLVLVPFPKMGKLNLGRLDHLDGQIVFKSSSSYADGQTNVFTSDYLSVQTICSSSSVKTANILDVSYFKSYCTLGLQFFQLLKIMLKQLTVVLSNASSYLR